MKPYTCQTLSYEKIVFSYKVLLLLILEEQEIVEKVAVTGCILHESLREKKSF